MAGGRTIALLAAVALAAACAHHRPGTPRPDYAHLAQQLNYNAGQAVDEAVAKETEPPGTPPAPRSETRHLAPGEPLWLQSGKSVVVELSRPVKRVSIGDPDLAGIVVLGPRTIMLNAKRLPERANGEAAHVASGRAAIVTNRTMTPEPRLEETTFTVWDGTDAPDVHGMIVADFIDQQVMLEVTVAEINRTAAEQHGIDFRAMRDSFINAFFMGGGAGPAALAGGGSTVPPNGTGILPLGTTATAPTYAFVLPQEDITGFIEALQTEGLATVLAQPKIVAMSGQNAVFQVGGEIPIRVATGFSTDVEFKPFGTIVNFVARVAEEGEIVLTVTPEVSQPDFTALVEGIPTFRTRRASTATRLRDGQTLVIGGLLQTTRKEQVSGVPYLKDIPIVGYVFRQSVYEDEVTELLVVVTPRLVRPLPPGTPLLLPTERGPLTNEEIRTRPHPAEAARPRFPGVP